MFSHHRLPFLVLLCVLLAGCQQPPREYRQTLLVFGTLVNITFWGVKEDKAAAAIEAVREDLDFMHSAWHAWQPGPLGRTNALLASTGWFSANPSVLPLLNKGKTLSLQSGGLFNPAIGNLVALWGFHNDDLPKGPPPSSQAIAKVLAQNPQMSDIEIDGIRVRSTNPSVKLDFGAMAKGLAVDKVIDHLKRLGIENAIVNAGGDLKAIGAHGERPWRVGIRHPRQEGVLAAVNAFDGESIFTSGDYERFYDFQGKRYHHILDPRSGYPADNSASVTIIHTDAATADAAATALFITGPANWHALAKKMGLRYVMLVDKAGQIYMSPDMAQRIEFMATDIKPILSAPL